MPTSNPESTNTIFQFEDWLFASDTQSNALKFIYSEKATKFFDIFTLFLTVTTQDKSKVNILQNYVAFSYYMNFTQGSRDENLGTEIEQDYLLSALCADPSANGKNSIFYETIIF